MSKLAKLQILKMEYYDLDRVVSTSDHKLLMDNGDIVRLSPEGVKQFEQYVRNYEKMANRPEPVQKSTKWTKWVPSWGKK